MVEKMLINKRKELYQEAKKHFGVNAQMNLLMEECGELIQATNKFMRYPNNKEIEEKLAEEIGDVEILIEEMKTFFPFLIEKINEIKELKLERLQKTLQERKITDESENQENHFYA